MTCREFKHNATSLTLREVARGGDKQLLGHAGECAACGEWLREQRTLAGSLETLRARTAGLEAGPEVERALLRAFRQDTAPGADRAFRLVGKRSGQTPPAAAPSSPPIALRLDRFFEIGAYIAIAAALLVGVFLGIRLLQDRARPAPLQSQTAPEGIAPKVPKPEIAATAQTVDAQPGAAARSSATRPPVPAGRKQAPSPLAAAVSPQVSPDKVATAKTVGEDFQALTDSGYTALMFCDPLSCAAETQVVRVDLPAATNNGGQDGQPQMADLVVGYDGVVRAVRIVN